MNEKLIEKSRRKFAAEVSSAKAKATWFQTRRASKKSVLKAALKKEGISLHEWCSH